MTSTPVVNKLLDCAKAIEAGDLNRADLLIKDILTDNDDKLVKYFAEALVRRVYILYPRNPRPLVPSCTSLGCNLEYLFFPFFRFAELTTRSSIVEALTGKKRVHVIDFSLMASGQRWGYLLVDYINQSRDAISFHLTSIGPLLSRKGNYLKADLEKLSEEAKKLPIEFEVKHMVANSPAEIVEAAMKLERSSEDEAIVVRWEFELHKLLAQPGATETVLSKLKELKPEIMTVVEQEANLNVQDFLECFTESFRYHSIIFDSLDKDNFQRSNHCRVLWEMYFRRQISNLAAQEGTDQIVRHGTFAQWRDSLRHSGFRHFHLRNQFKGTFLGHWSEYHYHIEEKNLHPVLYRNDDLLLVASAWKPDPTHLNSESLDNWNQESAMGDGDTMQTESSSLLILSGTVSFPVFLEDQHDDEHIMIEGKVWSPECNSINQIAASAEIFDILEYICHANHLPLALTWMSNRRGVLRLENNACYLNDFTMVGFLKACGKHHLQEGTGVAGKVLQSNSMHFVSDISKLDVKDYPFIFEAWDFGLRGVVAIKLESIYMSSIDYVVEFFLPPAMKEISGQRLLINEITTILQKNSRNSWKVCTEEFNGLNISSEVDVRMEEVGRSNIRPAAISDSQLPALSDFGSLNSSQIRELCNIFTQTGDRVEVPEAHDQEFEEQNSVFRPEAYQFPDNEVVVLDHINTSATSKRRRTSEVWHYFDEVRENEKVWAKCRSCGTKYRGESTRGTTNLRKHLRSCPGNK